MRTAGLVVVALAVGATAACGGGGGGKQLTHEQFVTQANAICSDYNRRIKALGTPNSADDVGTYTDKAKPIAEEDVGKFKKLNPPDEDRENWKQFGELGDELIDSFGKIEKAVEKKDVTELRKLFVQGRARDAKSKTVANAMGATACANT